MKTAPHASHSSLDALRDTAEPSKLSQLRSAPSGCTRSLPVNTSRQRNGATGSSSTLSAETQIDFLDRRLGRALRQQTEVARETA